MNSAYLTAGTKVIVTHQWYDSEADDLGMTTTSGSVLEMNAVYIGIQEDEGMQVFIPWNGIIEVQLA